MKIRINEYGKCYPFTKKLLDLGSTDTKEGTMIKIRHIHNHNDVREVNQHKWPSGHWHRDHDNGTSTLFNDRAWEEVPVWQSVLPTITEEERELFFNGVSTHARPISLVLPDGYRFVACDGNAFRIQKLVDIS